MKTNWFKINPSEIIILTTDDIFYGLPLTLSVFISHLKIGNNCKDCNMKYDLCVCNYCDNCRLPYCLCNLKLIFKGVERNQYSLKEKQIIRNFATNWAIKNLRKYYIVEISNNINIKLDKNIYNEDRKFIMEFVYQLDDSLSYNANKLV